MFCDYVCEQRFRNCMGVIKKRLPKAVQDREFRTNRMFNLKDRRLKL